MDAQEKSRLLLQFYRSDRFITSIFLYSIVVGMCGILAAILGYDLFLKDNQLLKLIVFYTSAFLLGVISIKMLNYWKYKKRRFGELSRENGF